MNNTIDTGGYSLTINNSGGVVINGTLINSYNAEPNGDSLVKTNTGTLMISRSGAISPYQVFNVNLWEGTLAVEGRADNALFQVEQGSLIVDGTIAGLQLLGYGASISGTGSFGSVENFTGNTFYGGTGTFTPGDNGAPGIMQCDSFFPANLASVYDAFQIIINGTQPGVGYGQLL